MEGSSEGAGPSGAQPAVVPRSGSNKRKRSLQQGGLDTQVIEEAGHAARLEESQREDDFEKPAAKLLAYRKKSLELLEKMDEARRKLTLEKLNQGVEETLERFDNARDSLTNAAAAKVKKVEDDYAKIQLERVKERQAIEKEEKKNKDDLNRSRTDYALFYADPHNGLDNFVATVQTPEMEQEEDLEEEEMDDDEDDQEEDQEEEEDED